jgi:membrane protease YdiL (CAAX protease family)
MLSEKPWTMEAIIRSLLGIFICLCIGSVAVIGFHYSGHAGRTQIVFFTITVAAVILLGAALFIVSRPWTVGGLLRRMWMLLVCLSAGLSLAGVAQKIGGHLPESSSGEQMVIAEGAVLLFFVGYLRAHQMKWADAFGIRNRVQQAILAGGIVACIFLPIGEGLQRASAYVLTHFQIEPHEQQAVHVMRVTSAVSSRVLLGVLAIFLAPIAEEVFFRGMLYPAIKQAGYPRLALWGVSLVFACVHFNLTAFVPLFVLAVFLTVLYERTDNLLAPITAHALFNSFNFIFLYLLEHQMGK